MAKTTIEWTDVSWNPVRGCTKISPGCRNCYAEAFAERFRGVPGHPYEQGFDLRLVPEKLEEPLSWKKPRRVFVNSMSDLFHEGVPFGYAAATFGVMMATKQHVYQVLTKRPERMLEFFAWLDTGEDDARAFIEESALQHVEACHLQADTSAWPLANVWLGVSVEDRKFGLPRIDLLRQAPAAIRFLSIEPLIEDLGVLDLTGIHWVIVGGESGAGARPMHPDWARSLQDQCVAAKVPFFFKQYGSWVPLADGATVPAGKAFTTVCPLGAPTTHGSDIPCDQHAMLVRTSKKAAPRLLDGREWNEFPEMNK